MQKNLVWVHHLSLWGIMVRQAKYVRWSLSQDENLEQIYRNSRKVVNFFTFVAMEVREILASLGFRSLKMLLKNRVSPGHRGYLI